MNEPPREPDPATSSGLRSWLVEMPRWKKVALLVAGALSATGAVLMFVDGGATAAGGAAQDGQRGLETGLTATAMGGSQPGQFGAADEPVAKGVFRLGFSFIAGFCLGAFVRATLKVAAIAFGFWLAMTVALAYYGLVEVNWQGIDQLWAGFAGNVASEWGSFQRFLTGSLPAAGLLVGGFAIGLRRP